MRGPEQRFRDNRLEQLAGIRGPDTEHAVRKGELDALVREIVFSCLSQQLTTRTITLFTDVSNGLAPASGGGTTGFLRADGSWAAPPGSVGNTFETVSKNLDAENATYTYSGGLLTEIAYASGVIKTLNYTGSDLTSVVLSGSTPGGIDLTKTFTYSGGDLTAVSYS